MSNVKSYTMTASLTRVAGAAVSATAHTFSTSAGDCPAKVEMFSYTTPNYTTAQDTTIFIRNSLGTVLWSGSAVAEATAKTEALSTYDVYVIPGDYIYCTTGGDIGANATFTFKVLTRTLDQ